MDKAHYFIGSHRKLTDTQFYDPPDTDLTCEAMQRVNLYEHEMLQRGQISEETYSYLTTGNDRTQQFYKIHKNLQHCLSIPTVPGIGGPIEKVSQNLDHFIGPLVPLSNSYIRNCTHMININNEMEELVPQVFQCT